MAILKKKDKDGYIYGFKWERYYNVKNPSETALWLVYHDDEADIDDPMADVVKEGKMYVARKYPYTERFTTLTDAKRWAESKVIGMGDYLTKPRSVKKTATKKRTVKRK